MISVEQLPFFAGSADDAEGDSNDEQRASWYSADSLLAPRRSHRVVCAEQLCVTGLDIDLADSSAPLLVRGRDISADGVSFTHLRPMPFRYIRLLLPTADGLQAVIVRLTWCRYARHGQYVSGGYFVRAVDVEPDAGDEWDTLDEA